jgi:hypothetical protein
MYATIRRQHATKPAMGFFLADFMHEYDNEFTEIAEYVDGPDEGEAADVLESFNWIKQRISVRLFHICNQFFS